MKPTLTDLSGKLPGEGAIPPLEPGDRLTRDEFERRYEARPHLRKAELVEGVVYMPSPVRMYRHGQRQADLIGLFFIYRTSTPGVLVGDNATARLDLDNEPQPDAMLIIDPLRGGQTKISEDDYVEGAPELVCEIASSSVSFDLHTKFNVYRRCGVKEYIVWRVLDRVLDWFVLRGSNYERLSPAADGLLKSEVFPGLWLNANALMTSDLITAVADLQSGLAHTEHANFVDRLAKAAKT